MAQAVRIADDAATVRVRVTQIHEVDVRVDRWGGGPIVTVAPDFVAAIRAARADDATCVRVDMHVVGR